VCVPKVRNLDVRDSFCEALLQPNEVIYRECPGAARGFDAIRVVYDMNLGIRAFEQKVTASAGFVLRVQENTALDHFQLPNVSDFERETGI
jgi:hypothetical protein